MKRCPTCNRTYADLSLNFCLDDGTPLTSDAAPTTDLNATIRYPPPRETSEPPPTEIYRPAPQTAPPQPTAPPPTPPPQWSPTPPAPPRKKSNAIWWILGGFAAFVVIGVGLIVMIIALASMGSGSNTNIGNSNTRDPNRNANISANANTNANTNANANVAPPSSLADDFSQQKWGTGTSQYGRIWYADEKYHMTSKEGTFVVMYAPSNEYSTENATVSVTARSVTGSVPSAGFGLMVHCLQTRAGQLEDYGLLIFPSDEPEYEVIMHKAGVQSSLVKRTKSDAIKTGSEENKLEVRIRGSMMLFYANGKILTTVQDRENFRRGRVGFYTSDIHEIVFDDLEIERSTP
jgi:hypothetical protein